MKGSEPTVSNAVSLVSECAEGSPRIITSKSISNLSPISCLPGNRCVAALGMHSPRSQGALRESNWHLRPHRKTQERRVTLNDFSWTNCMALP